MAVALAEPQNKKAQTVWDVDFKSDSSILSFVKEKWDSRDQYRNQIERQWFINIAQYLGYQYHVYDDFSGSLRLPTAPSYRVRLVCNVLLPIVRKILAKAMRQRPTFTAIPATQDQEDALAAFAAMKALQYYWRYLELDTALIDAILWLATTGNVFGRVYWDPAKLSEVSIPAEVQDFLGEEDRDFLQSNRLQLGDLAIEFLSPFEILPDPNCLKLKDATYLIHSKTRSIDYLEARYPKARGKIKSDADSHDNLTKYYERRIQEMTGPSVWMQSKDRSEDEGCCMVHQLWVAPCGKHPTGAYACVGGGVVLKRLDTLPNPMKKIPYVHAREIPVPGRFWGTCALEQCIPEQADINRARSQLCENRNLMSKPKWLVPNGGNVSDTIITSEPGEKIYYNYPFKPEPVSPVPIPDYVFKTIDLAVRGIEDKAAVHEVTQARTSVAKAGVAIAQLQEQDDQTLAPTFLELERALATLGSWALQILAENVPEERVLKILGENREVESFVFTGRSLLGPNAGRPGVNYFDVECQLMSQLPLSRMAKQERIFESVRLGILNPQDLTDKRRILRALEFGEDELNITDEHADRQAALRESVMLCQGVFTQANSWDDHLLHIEAHRRFQKQPEFRRVATPEIVQAFEQHIAMHVLYASGQVPPPEMSMNQGAPGGLALQQPEETPLGLEPMPPGPNDVPAEEAVAQAPEGGY